jgi:hypothetical protein
MPLFFTNHNYNLYVYIYMPISPLKPPTPRNKNNNQTTRNQRPSHRTHNNNTAPTRRKLAPYNIMLRLKVSVKPYHKHNNTNRDKRSA